MRTLCWLLFVTVVAVIAFLVGQDATVCVHF